MSFLRGERVDDLYLIDQGSAPTEEGLLRRAGNDVLVYVNGTAYSIIQQGIPATTAEGQVVFSADGVTFTVEQPLTSSAGWLVNDDGILLVTG